MFGEVPDSVKESLAAKEATREAAVRQQQQAEAEAAAGKNGKRGKVSGVLHTYWHGFFGAHSFNT